MLTICTFTLCKQHFGKQDYFRIRFRFETRQPYQRSAIYTKRQSMLASNIQVPTLVFPKGRYDFWAQHAIEKDYHETNTYDVNPKILAVLLEQINDLTIDGNGSEFIMHGRMQPFTLDHCRNITLKNFSVDWEIPLTAQGIVTQSTSGYLEIEIDSHQYPYIIENKRLTFCR